jgi:hypothetical protein
MRLVFLDTGTLGMLANARGTPRPGRCQQWARNLLATGFRVFVPDVCENVGHREECVRSFVATCIEKLVDGKICEMPETVA